MTWAPDELERITAAKDFRIAPFREDGVTCGTPTYIWFVVVDGSLYVRAYNGTRSRWHAAALRQGAGRIVVDDRPIKVDFAPVEDLSRNDAIDQAYRDKYSGSRYLAPMISERTRAATVEVLPRDVTG